MDSFPWHSKLFPNVLKFPEISRFTEKLVTLTKKQARKHSLAWVCTDYLSHIFTARCYASTVLAMALCLSVCLSITSRSSTKTAKRRITQTALHDSPGTLFFWSQRSPQNSTGVTPYGGAKCRWGGSKSATGQITGYISKTVHGFY